MTVHVSRNLKLFFFLLTAMNGRGTHYTNTKGTLKVLPVFAFAGNIAVAYSNFTYKCYNFVTMPHQVFITIL